MRDTGKQPHENSGTETTVQSYWTDYGSMTEPQRGMPSQQPVFQQTAPQPPAPQQAFPQQTDFQQVPPQQSTLQSIVLCQDGKYRWAYEFGLFKNPTILFLIWKIFAGIGIGLMLLMFALAVFDNDGDILGTAEDFVGEFPIVLIGFGVMLLVTGLGYAVYALINGGKYCVAFEMDDSGITHRQMPAQVKKAEVVGMINVLAGIATGNMTQAGIGLTSAQSELSSDFASVRSVDGNRRRCVIKVSEPFAKNQVYVEPADYDFVMGYVARHCPNARVSDR